MGADLKQMSSVERKRSSYTDIFEGDYEIRPVNSSSQHYKDNPFGPRALYLVSTLFKNKFPSSKYHWSISESYKNESFPSSICLHISTADRCAVPLELCRDLLAPDSTIPPSNTSTTPSHVCSSPYLRFHLCTEDMNALLDLRIVAEITQK